MKGLILAGGKGTRLYPTTRVVNKHILLVYDRPMIMHPILTLRDAGITDIIISLSYENPQQMMELLGDGKELGVKLTYIIHGEPKGISYGIYHARHVLGCEPFVCLLGDNIFTEGLKSQIEKFKANPDKSLVVLKKVRLEEANRYGVAEFDWEMPESEIVGYGKPLLRRVIEKPQKPPSSYIMTGAYMLTTQFFDIYPSLTPSNRGEFEITDAINALMPNVMYEIYDDQWFDVGTFESIMEASNYLREHKHG